MEGWKDGWRDTHVLVDGGGGVAVGEGAESAGLGVPVLAREVSGNAVGGLELLSG